MNEWDELPDMRTSLFRGRRSLIRVNREVEDYVVRGVRPRQKRHELQPQQPQSGHTNASPQPARKPVDPTVTRRDISRPNSNPKPHFLTSVLLRTSHGNIANPREPPANPTNPANSHTLKQAVAPRAIYN
ncbi:hypothetical protein BDDG_05628 [Blastomyces dermatitidis ATCC 18188]|uniref:Uncharacterized protein n=1 Tax=Ajellomyces dermatitidis (strain ATCC 18188 / CBS 674.68) TaxID=653446 RepID=F2THH1_AJEDA|nr:hypothetical protein BDDG_05628 [Blastomyces dermatitidis ATCC 18188]EQL32586.1 hypothetical protein BDFG_05256 [Blastomyces dermatitidis ATCC 26199]